MCVGRRRTFDAKKNFVLKPLRHYKCKYKGKRDEIDGGVHTITRPKIFNIIFVFQCVSLFLFCSFQIFPRCSSSSPCSLFAFNCLGSCAKANVCLPSIASALRIENIMHAIQPHSISSFALISLWYVEWMRVSTNAPESHNGLSVPTRKGRVFRWQCRETARMNNVSYGSKGYLYY